MIVRVAGFVWLPKNELTSNHIVNIKRELTIIPRRTTDIQAKQAPQPIFLFEESETELGVPREWYLKNVTRQHEEKLEVSYGIPMQPMKTKWRADGPFKEQEDALRVMQNKMDGNRWCGFLLRASCGFGKGLRHGEPVLSENGYVNIENLKVGDRVAGTDGLFHNVMGVYPQGIKDIYRITFTDNTHVDCDEDHIWKFVLRRSGYKEKTITTKDLYSIQLEFENKLVFWTPLVKPIEHSLRKNAGLDHISLQLTTSSRAVTNVEYIGKDYSTCISVDSPDNLFLTRNSIPTHNTQCTLELARRIGRNTVITIHKDFFLEQWRKSILSVMPDAKIGIIKQNKCDYKDKDFVIAMIQSLSKDSGNKYPEEIWSYFGTLIADEVHRVAAQSWSCVVPMFSAAYKIAASATPRRKDGTENVFIYNISDVTYAAKTQSQIPGLRILKTDYTTSNLVKGGWFVKACDMNSAQLMSQLCDDPVRTKEIVEQIVEAIKVGRKVMVVSERLSHLKEMSELVCTKVFGLNLPFEFRADYYTGEWYTGEVWQDTNKKHKRGDPKLRTRTSEELERAESANVIFATKQCTEEGLDIASIDVIVLASPMSDCEQTVGRVRRWCLAEEGKCEKKCPWRAGKCKEKPKPIVLDVVDELVPKLVSKWNRRKQFYKSIGMIK